MDKTIRTYLANIRSEAASARDERIGEALRRMSQREELDIHPL